ncbi:MAG: hypothetical protein M3Q29_25510, partial [Chloroflexota bacterium]|nr:hypothetical protein [Chloroflexota bacterium]
NNRRTAGEANYHGFASHAILRPTNRVGSFLAAAVVPLFTAEYKAPGMEDDRVCIDVACSVYTHSRPPTAI